MAFVFTELFKQLLGSSLWLDRKFHLVLHLLATADQDLAFVADPTPLGMSSRPLFTLKRLL